MKIFNCIRKKLLRKKKYKYLLKSNDAASKAKHLLQLSKDYKSLSLSYPQNIPTYESLISHSLKKSTFYHILSDHYEHSSQIYLEKKLDIEMELLNFL